MKSFIPDIPFDSLTYDLPESRIALFPLKDRDSSKLLHYNKDGVITDRLFHELPDILAPDTLLIGNNTQVIPARLLFQAENGATIEVFLLEPLNNEWSVWKVMVGNRKKFAENDVLKLSDKQENKYLQVTWYHRDSNIIFLKVPSGCEVKSMIAHFGNVPLPPYIKREVTDQDENRYQTVFAQVPGAVAAPTASLHFTDKVISELKDRGITLDYLTLHVGAGTFKPVTAEFASGHDMHHEKFIISSGLVRHLIEHLSADKPIIAIGTTSFRVLESLYFLGIMINNDQNAHVNIPSDIGFWPNNTEIRTVEALKKVLCYLEANGDFLSGFTSIFILPGFRNRICSGIITNFHQPGSTLIALVAACIGQNWEKVYSHALDSDYRFLSYGDSSLLEWKK